MKKLLVSIMVMMIVAVLVLPLVAYAGDGTTSQVTDVVTMIMQKGIMVFLAVYVVCAVIKEIPKLPNWIIPIMALILGCILGAFLIGLDAASIIIGALAGWAAVGGNQTLKQTILKRIGLGDEEDTDEKTDSDTSEAIEESSIPASTPPIVADGNADAANQDEDVQAMADGTAGA